MCLPAQQREEEEEKEEKPKPNSQSRLGHRAGLLSARGYNQSLVWKASHTLAWKLSHRFQVHAWNIPFRLCLEGVPAPHFALIPKRKGVFGLITRNSGQASSITDSPCAELETGGSLGCTRPANSYRVLTLTQAIRAASDTEQEVLQTCSLPAAVFDRQ